MKLKDGLKTIIEYAILITILSIILERLRFNRNPSYRTIFRFIHYIILIFFVSHVFILDKKYDYIYLVSITLMNISWELNEHRCILSDIETINEKDKKNSYHPYFEVFIGKKTDILVLLQLAFMIYNFYMIIVRNDNVTIKIISLLLGSLITYKLLRSRVKKLYNYFNIVI
jgi:hypothetical protein|tara:strand:+ start:484 stop:996 length:513 start_codon:yes stop_codon:yes gene_type:complete